MIKPKAPTSQNVLLSISSIYASMTKAEKKVADAVQANPEEAVLYTITDLSEKAGVGETSVIRFCRKLGFGGYHEFKLAIAQHVVSEPRHFGGEIQEGDGPAAVVQKLTSRNARVIQDTGSLVSPAALEEAVRALLSGKRIRIYGVGASGMTAMDAYYSFMRVGLPVEAQRDGHIIAMSAALANEDDVVFGISTSGSTKDLVDTMKTAKRNGATTICLTSQGRSPITQYADIVLLVPAKESPFQGGSLSAKIAQMHVLDLLSSLVIVSRKQPSIESITKTANAVAEKLY
ncbi:MurR/RpiR family transcriptional regulator [Paenibacillus antri]|uniref:MurR/RpiR family transcriptional regulator n=1 Tax=Paenibacillus antri TaxID=2582848 RepID=A0A5R9GBY0_9BACL|nr:MurR/RpiR family transcriptional regulator [Paenibacillus antri]TLS51570.1 MurR/RpiR family transcriptional regulator [Paenibacillus antri]